MAETKETIEDLPTEAKSEIAKQEPIKLILQGDFAMDTLRKTILIGVLFIGLNIIGTPLYAESPEMTFVYMENYAPFCFNGANGNVIGIQPEIVQYIADKLDIKVVHKLYPWERSQSGGGLSIQIATG